MKLEFNRENDLINAGCENVESYMLVNNYGYKFNKKGFKYDLRHWLNCYGADVNFWDLTGYYKDTITGNKFNTIDEALKYIQTL